MSKSVKRVVIIGASNGIGRAVAQSFLDKGHYVNGVDLEDQAISGERYRHYLCDLSDVRSVDDVCKELEKEAVTDLVYCAAEQHIFPSLEPDLKLIHRMLTTNVVSGWHIIARIQKKRLEVGTALNSVVLVSSVHAIATSGSIAGYAMTKAALSSLVRSLAIDLAPHKTRVNGVIPGAVKTRMLTAHLTDDDLEKLASRQLVDHIADPSEIAGAIAFLASDEATYVTGQNFIIDGGVLALLATEAD